MNPKPLIRIVNAFAASLFISASYAQELHVNPAFENCSIELDPSLTQSQFHKFTREAGMFLTFKLLAPAEPLGAKKFELGLEYSRFRIDDSDPAWNNTFSHPDENHYLGEVIKMPKLFARMGVSDRIDVGFYFTKNPEANYGFLGGEMKYAFFQEPAKPAAAAVRASYATLLGVDDMDFHVFGVDVSTSKNLGMLTPYLGIGVNLARGIETTSKVNLDNETILTPRGIIGARFSISIISLTAEMDIAALSTFSLRAGFQF
jgi:hypothetical protein